MSLLNPVPDLQPNASLLNQKENNPLKFSSNKNFSIIYFYCYFTAIFISRNSLITIPNSSMSSMGALDFILLSLIISFVSCVPILLVETSIGQFTGFSTLQLFSFIRILKGLGMTCFLFHILKTVLTGVDNAIWLAYLVEALTHEKLPWSSCANYYNSKFCRSDSTNTSFYSNSSRTASLEYFEFRVMGLQRKKESPEFISQTHGSFFNVYLMVSLFVVYFLTFPCILKTKKVRLIYIISCIFFSFACLFTLLIYSFTISGSWLGISRLFRSSFSFKRLIETSGDLYLVVFYQSGIMNAMVTTIASQNMFHFNFNRAVISIFILRCVFEFLSNIFVFSMIGRTFFYFDLFLKNTKGVSTNYLINLVLLMDCFSEPYSRYWIVIYFFWNFILGFDDLIISVETIYLTLISEFPVIRSQLGFSRSYLIICGVLFFFGILFCNTFILNIHYVLVKSLYLYLYPFILCLTLFLFFYVYGITQLKIDFKMMINHTFSWYWLFGILVPFPIFIVSIFTSRYPHHDSIPIGALYLSYVLTSAFLLPLLYKAVYTIIIVFQIEPKTNFSEIKKYCFKPPPNWGPRLKKYWSGSEFYSKKLMKVFNDAEFIQSIKQTENLIPTLLFVKHSSDSRKTVHKHVSRIPKIDPKYL